MVDRLTTIKTKPGMRLPACCILTGLLVAMVGCTAKIEQKSAAQKNSDGNETNLPPGAEVLAIVWQVADSLEELVAKKEISLVHNEDAILHAANAPFYSSPTNAPTLPARMDRDQFMNWFGKLRQQGAVMHLHADRGDQAELEKRLPTFLETFEKFKALYPEPTVRAARGLAERYMCPMHPEEAGHRTNSCGKCGMEMDQRIRIVPSHPAWKRDDEQTITMSVRAEGPIRVGQLARVDLLLSKKRGEPVLTTDLIETHTQKIHLLIIDGSLEDYHHEHPQPMSTPGVYSFSFTPRKPGPYRIWADLRPSPLGIQEYIIADIPSAAERGTLTNKLLSYTTTVEGLKYELTLTRRIIRVGYPVQAKLRISNADGTGFEKLEPLMATFAHLVGFNEDYQTVLHLHPKGPLITDPKSRGGPELEFQFYALKPGFIRLFAQVQIDGQSKFAPFGLMVGP